MTEGERFDENQFFFLQGIKDQTMGRCEKCVDGWIKNDKPCSCRMIFVYLKELVYARIPREYWSQSIKDLDVQPESASILVDRYIDNFETAARKGKGMCFLGSNGIGKTSLLIEIGKRSVQLGFDTIYVTVQDYINHKMINDYDNLSRIEEQAKVVLLDELDKPYKKKGSDYVVAQIENLFRSLIPRDIVVCVGSNWKKEEVKDYYGDSTYSIMKRKIKFVSLLGDDHSDDLQDSWEEDLGEGKMDYLSKYFVESARRMSRWHQQLK